MDALEWKRFYERERAEIGDAGLADLVHRAPAITFPKRGAIVFPHTRLRISGELVAAVAKAVVLSSAREVVALGVLHGARREDADAVVRARGGDAVALHALRRIHGPETIGDGGYWSEEFSLDNFTVLVDVAARVLGRPAPHIVRRFPFLVGDAPDDLPGLSEISARVAHGALVVATTDPIHHGVGYGTPPAQLRAIDDPATVLFARTTVEQGLSLLARRDYAAFARHAAEHRSDFRDVGPTLAALLPTPMRFDLRAMTLVDYAEALATAQPTWVAAPLTVIESVDG